MEKLRYNKRNYKNIKKLYQDLKLIDSSLKIAKKAKLRKMDYEFINLVEHSFMFNVNFYNWCVNNEAIPKPKSTNYRNIDKDFNNAYGKKLDKMVLEINDFFEENLLIDTDNLSDNGIVKYLTVKDLKNILVSNLSPGINLRKKIIKQSLENELSIATEIIKTENLFSIKQVYLNEDFHYIHGPLKESRSTKKIHLKEEIKFISYFTKIMIYLELDENNNNNNNNIVNKRKKYSNKNYEQLVFSI